ncbi:hypothetical protein, partial [Sphingobacterium detergens]|uniref:hypothetical protein n=1 Tax=Sphingobacterium detergens TaxID=1145106 RepID=UPI001ABF819D
NRWESRSVPFFTRKPLLETVKGFFRLHTSQKVSIWILSKGQLLWPKSHTKDPLSKVYRDPATQPYYPYRSVWYCFKVLRYYLVIYFPAITGPAKTKMTEEWTML